MKAIYLLVCVLGLFFATTTSAQKLHPAHKIVGQWTAPSITFDTEMMYDFRKGNKKGGKLRVSDPVGTYGARGKWHYDEKSMLLTTTTRGVLTTWNLVSVDRDSLILKHKKITKNVIFTRAAKMKK